MYLGFECKKTQAKLENGGTMKFTKMEGCGNDYVYVNGFDTKK